MIITCKECSTNFNLDDSLVKEAGSQCRCSVCKHVFTAYPLLSEQEQEQDQFIDKLLTPESETPELEIDDDDFTLEFEEDDIEINLSDLEMEEEVDSKTDEPEFKIEEVDSETDELEFKMDIIEDDKKIKKTEIEDTELMFEETDLELETSDFEMEDSQSDQSDFDLDLDLDGDFLFEEEELDIDEEKELQEINSFDLDNGELDFEPPVQDDDDTDGIEFETFNDDDDTIALFENSDSALTMKNDNIPDFDTGLDDLNPGDFAINDNDDDDTDTDEFKIEFDENIDENANTKQIAESNHKESTILSDENKIENLELEIPVVTPANKFSEYDEVLEQETEPEDENVDEDKYEEAFSAKKKTQTIEMDDLKTEERTTFLEEENPLLIKQVSPLQRRTKRKTIIGTPVLMFLLICILVVGAYAATIFTGYKIPYLSDINIPFIEQYLKKEAPKVVDIIPAPNQKSVNGRFVTNTSAGTLFIITGKVENHSKITTYSHIQVKGTLSIKGNKQVKIKNVFCGNIIPEEVLKTGTIADIDKALVIKTGKNNLNVSIKPGASISFMVVFSNFPATIQNFSVEVIKFDKK